MDADSERTGLRHRLQWLWGPAFVAAIAYVDPGNVAANLTAGAEYGYLLVWVLVAANTMAMLVQYLSAKLGLVTGRSLPALLGERLGTGPRLLFLLQAEIVAAATDLAEVIGGAIALNILFGVPLLLGGVIIGAVSMGLLAVQNRRGEKTFEAVVVALLVVITIGFVAGLFVSAVDWPGAVGGVLPRFAGPDSVLLAASMLGATVMPHAIYVHSAITTHLHDSSRSPKAMPRMLRATRWDVMASMLVAGTVNIAMLLLAAANLQGETGTDSIEGAWAAINSHLGPAVGVLFGVGLLASGLASTSVGTFAGATILDGLLKVKLSPFVIRLVTLAPALAILALGVSPTWALVVSQVVLSFGIPFALIPLAALTRRHDVMGTYANTRVLVWAAAVVIALIIALNVFLLVELIAG
ncbi:MAG: Nramp family divalent metal transporter [Propionibacteriaceae bacterium]|nr:Nramp family divalent metal transporter [Propionibacteriaceae bacterium]